MSCSLYSALERQGVLHTGHSPLPLPFGTQHFPSELKVGRVDVRVQRDVSHPPMFCIPFRVLPPALRSSNYAFPCPRPEQSRPRPCVQRIDSHHRSISQSCPRRFRAVFFQRGGGKIRGWARQGQCKIAGRGASPVSRKRRGWGCRRRSQTGVRGCATPCSTWPLNQDMYAPLILAAASPTGPGAALREGRDGVQPLTAS